MSMNDPLGDMLTRIRNAQMRRTRTSSDARLDAARPRPRRAASRKATSAATRTTEYGNGRTEFEIELKYYDGEPVIREIAARLEARPPRLCRRSTTMPRVAERPRHLHPVDAAGRHGGPRGPREECRRRSALPGLLTGRHIETGDEHVSRRQEARRGPVRRDGDGRRPDGQGEGPEGRTVVRRARRGRRSRSRTAPITVDAARRDQARALACGACPARMVANLVEGVTKGFEKKLEITGVGYARRCRARC